jgi:hypothetical protein
MLLDVGFGERLYRRKHLHLIGQHVLWILGLMSTAWGVRIAVPDDWGVARLHEGATQVEGTVELDYIDLQGRPAHKKAHIAGGMPLELDSLDDRA